MTPMKCPACATENPEGSRFCMSCAAPLAAQVPQAPPPPVAPPPPPIIPPHLRHRQPHEDLVGLMALAFFLIAVSVAVAMNPNLVADLQAWTHQVSSRGTVFVRPPEGILASAAWFFGVIGALEFVAAGFRWALRWTPLRVAGRVLAGVGDLVFSALLFLYSAKTIAGTFLLAILAGTVGVLLLLYLTVGLYWASVRGLPRPEAARPPARQ